MNKVIVVMELKVRITKTLLPFKFNDGPLLRRQWPVRLLLPPAPDSSKMPEPHVYDSLFVLDGNSFLIALAYKVDY